MILLFVFSGIISILFIFLFLREKKKSRQLNKCAEESHRESKRLERCLAESRQGYETYARIGRVFSRGEGVDELLELILDECQKLTSADAGTLYRYNQKNEKLDFKIMHTNSQGIRQGGTSDNEIKLKPVPLYKGDKPNRANVSSSCALSGKTINIPDVYEEEGYDFTGTRKYDSSTGYRSHSMLVMPMKDLEGKMIGVIQLINSLDKETGQPVRFTRNHEEMVSLLTAHAASTLNNVELINQLKALFDAFIDSIASTMDEKSPYTGDHINRVVKLTTMITNAVNEAKEGPFKNVNFTSEERDEILMAAKLHDIGKLTTPDGLVNKSTKLELFEDRIELIRSRFELIEQLASTEKEKELIREERTFIDSCNQPGEFMDDDRLARLEEIASKTYEFKGERRPYITALEKEKLAIRKGTLTADERDLMQNHVTMTKTILDQLPFPDNLSHVPDYAAMHHEKLDGSGYFRGLSAEEIPLQARIIAVSDIFEALTARDRPYRKPIGWSRALEIIKKMSDDNELDCRLHDLLFSSGVARDYSRQELEDTPEEAGNL